jgi:hypothetical protein
VNAEDEISKFGSPDKDSKSAPEADKRPRMFFFMSRNVFYANTSFSLTVIVKFTGPDPCEVWIPAANRPDIIITKKEDLGTSSKYFLSLKQLLPVAIEQASPIKSS